MPDFSRKPWSDLAEAWGTTIGPIVLISVVALVGLRVARIFVHGVVKTLMEREATEGTAQELSAVEVKKRVDTIETLASNVLQFLIVAVAVLIVLDKLGENIGPAIAGFGIAGIAIGFGAQNLVKDYLNGALILIENHYSKGDVVRIAGVSGTVEDFSLRRTTLRDLDGVVHTVPNGAIIVASNQTRVWARINQDVTVSYGTDIDNAIEIVNAVGKAMQEDPVWKRRLLEAPRVERVEALGEYGVTLKILGTVRAPERWNAAGELRKQLLAAFHESGIEIPQPQRVVFQRQPGAASGVPPPSQDLGPAPPAPTQDDLAEGSE